MYTSDEWKKKLSTCLYVTSKNMPHPPPFHPQPAWNGQIHGLAHSADALHWVAGHNWAPNEPMIQSSSPGRHKTRVLAKSWMVLPGNLPTSVTGMIPLWLEWLGII